MTNFNHERLSIAVGVTRQARVALSAAFEYVLKREAFGRPLMDQPVVRHRLAKAGALLESQWAWVEQFAYQLTQMPKEDGDRELGGLTGLLKAQAGLVLKECADTAMLLFGGNGYTRSGQGELIESECYPLRASLGAFYGPISGLGALILTFNVYSDLAGRAWCEDPWWLRGCPVGPGRAPAGQTVQGQDEGFRKKQDLRVYDML